MWYHSNNMPNFLNDISKMIRTLMQSAVQCVYIFNHAGNMCLERL